MTVSRLITFMTALPDYAVQQLPPMERVQLARECWRLMLAADVLPSGTPANDDDKLGTASPGGVLALIKRGDRAP